MDPEMSARNLTPSSTAESGPESGMPGVAVVGQIVQGQLPQAGDRDSKRLSGTLLRAPCISYLHRKVECAHYRRRSGDRTGSAVER